MISHRELVLFLFFCCCFFSFTYFKMPRSESLFRPVIFQTSLCYPCFLFPFVDYCYKQIARLIVEIILFFFTQHECFLSKLQPSGNLISNRMPLLNDKKNARFFKFLTAATRVFFFFFYRFFFVEIITKKKCKKG